MSGRIPQHFIDDLLARVNIVDVVDARIKLKRAGKNYSALCPFHKEKSPSFSVSPDKQFYYCFGCGAGGNAVGFVMEYDRLSFPEAVEELSRTVGMEVPREQESSRDLERERRVKQQFELLDRVNEFYRHQLRTHSDKERAVTYLKGRGITGQIAARFQLGFAPPGWNTLNELGQEDELLLKAGLMVENEEKGTRYDRFRDRIIFPIRDMRGRTVGFGGRVLNDEKPKYLNSPETDTFHKGRELYGLYEARQLSQRLDRLLIVEGYMDVVSLAQNGLTWSVATLGTATTPTHLERVFKLVSEVVFCFDGDAAGRQAAHRALDTTLPLITDGLMAKFLFLPEGEDPDTLIQQEGLEAFIRRVDQALPLSEFFFKSLSEGVDLASMDGRASLSTVALPKIQSMQPSLLQQMMLERVAEITGLGMEQLNAVARVQQRREQPVPLPNDRSQDRQPLSHIPERDERNVPPPDEMDHYFSSAEAPRLKARSGAKISLVSSAISILLHRPDLARTQVEAVELEGIEIEHIELLQRLLADLQASEEPSLGMLVSDWQQTPERSADLFVLSEISQLDPVLENVDAERLLQDALNRVLERKTSAELDRLKRVSRARALSDEEKARLQQLLMRQSKKN